MTKPPPDPANVDDTNARSSDAAASSQTTADPTDGVEAQKLRDKRQNQEKAEGD
jgi:hypothetical protein